MLQNWNSVIDGGFSGKVCQYKIACEQASPIWASEANLARTRERGAEERRCPVAFPLPLAASPLAHAFSRDSLRLPK